MNIILSEVKTSGNNINDAREYQRWVYNEDDKYFELAVDRNYVITLKDNTITNNQTIILYQKGEEGQKWDMEPNYSISTIRADWELELSSNIPELTIEAFENYNNALELDPKHRGTHEYIGRLYLNLGQLKKAKMHLKNLDEICFFGCKEYSMLKKAVEDYQKTKLVKDY